MMLQVHVLVNETCLSYSTVRSIRRVDIIIFYHGTLNYTKKKRRRRRRRLAIGKNMIFIINIFISMLNKLVGT